MSVLQGPAVRIAGTYALVAGIWIWASDHLLARTGLLPAWGQTLKGWLFVTVTAILVGVLVHRAWERQERLAQRLRESRKMDALGRLAQAVAHDFSNLLTVIVGYTGLVRSRLPDSAEGHHQLGLVLDASDRAALLTRQLLSFSRRSSKDSERYDLKATLQDMAGLLAALAGKGVDLRIEHRAGPCWIRGGRVQMEQALLNLTTNARQAMPHGGCLLLKTSSRSVTGSEAGADLSLPEGPYVLLTVSDTGQGMDEATQERIFEPFFTTKEQGTGLGLSTVYSTVRQHGGGIWVHSEKGVGTTFRLYLPEDTGPDEEPGASPNEDRPIQWARTHLPPDLTVLIAEDDEQVRRFARLTLEEAGCRILEAEDGDGALERAREEEPDLLIVDIALPGMDGQTLARRLRRQAPSLAVLFITGHPAFLNGDEPGQLLEKPFSPTELLEAVETLIRSSTAGP